LGTDWKGPAARIGCLVPIRIPSRSESGMSALLTSSDRSRTLVMHSVRAPFYRFFLRMAPHSLHGSSFSTSCSACLSASVSPRFPERAQNAPVEARAGVFAARLHSGSGGVVVAGFGKQRRSLAQPGASRLLLRLRAGPCPRRVRQNVRAKEVCGALVGHQLCQAARPQPDQQVRCGAKVAASRAR
jgi:hypothetical protein